VTQEESSRPNLPPVSEQMKAWSAALASEISDWPLVASRAFFGLTALYRKDKIFAVLPRSRGMGTANSFGFKFETAPTSLLDRLDKDSRVGCTRMQKARWFTFELSSDADLHEGLEWLSQAYLAAGKTKKSK
jgi:hypothetical protein